MNFNKTLKRNYNLWKRCVTWPTHYTNGLVEKNLYKSFWKNLVRVVDGLKLHNLIFRAYFLFIVFSYHCKWEIFNIKCVYF